MSVTSRSFGADRKPMHYLSDAHRMELERGSAVSPALIEERGYFTASSPRDVPDLFDVYQRRPGMVIPIRDTTGGVSTFQLKANEPRLSKSGEQVKYDTAVGGRHCLDVPVRVRSLLGDPTVPLWITEGAKKVDSGLSNGVPCIIGVQGVYGWRGQNEQGGLTALADWEDIALKGREVVLGFDSDVMTKASVRAALDRLSAFVQKRGAKVRYLLLPVGLEGGMPGSSRKTGLDDYFAQGHPLADVQELIVDHLPAEELEWRAPLPLDDPSGPPFPVAALAGVISDMVLAVAEETQTPPDMAATTALATISAAAGGKYQVVLPDQGWNEPVHIMTIVVAEPGSRKSGVIQKLLEPLVAYERDMQPDEREALAQWASRQRVLEKQRDDAEKAAGKHADAKVSVSTVEATRMAAVRELEKHLRNCPRITRVIMDDATSEAVKTMLAEQCGAVAVMSAESAFLSNTVRGRYSPTGTPNLDVILNGHAGDAIIVDRKGRPHETVERACLSVCVMVQPQVVRDLGNDPGFVTRGGAARFLPSIPVDIVGRRRIDVTPIPMETTSRWHVAVRRIAARRPELRNGCYAPWSITLSPSATESLYIYRERHEPEMRPGGAYSDIRDWAGKQPGAVLRVAGLLHVALHEIPEAVPISADTLGRAITIVDYYADHARVMYRLIKGRSEHGNARAVLDAVLSLGSPTTTREVHRKLHSRMAFEKVDSLEGPLALLAEYGYIHRERRTGAKGGRPSELITLNPSIGRDRTDTTAPRVLGDAGSVIVFPDPLAEGSSASRATSTGDMTWEDF